MNKHITPFQVKGAIQLILMQAKRWDQFRKTMESSIANRPKTGRMAFRRYNETPSR